MAISYLGSCSGANEPTGLPAHQAGDLLVVFAFTDTGSPPGLAGGAGYISLATGGSGSYWWRIGYKFATDSSSTGGVWGTATVSLLSIFRGAGALLNVSERSGAGTTDFLYGNGFSLTNTDGESWVVGCIGTRDTDTNTQAPPAGMVNRSSRNATSNRASMHSTPSGVSSYSDQAVVQSGDGSPWRTVIFEMRPGSPISFDFTESSTTVNSNSYFDRQAVVSSVFVSNTLSSASYFDLDGNFNFTEGPTTVSSTAQLGRIANLSLTLPAQALSSQSYFSIDGNLSITESATTVLSSSALEKFADLSTTLLNETLSANALFSIEGSFSFIESGTSLSSTGDMGFFGTFDFTESATTVSSTTSQGRVGSLDYSLNDNSLIANALFSLEGDLDFTEGPTTVASTAQLGRIAELDRLLPHFTLAASASIGVDGDFDFIEGETTLSSTVAFGISADFALVENDTTALIEGIMGRTASFDFIEEDVDLFSAADLDSVAFFNFFENQTTLSSTIEKENVGVFVFTEDRTTLSSEATIPLTAKFDFIEDDTVLTHKPTKYPPECCTPPICQISPNSLVCDFIHLLPSGRMWDADKTRVYEEYLSHINEPEPHVYDLGDGDCSSIVLHSVYTAFRLHDALKNALWPAMRESNPFTAFNTLDDWLSRYGWVDCFKCAFPYPGECDISYCDVPIPEPLNISVKHAILVSLTRLDMGIIANVQQINWVIEPLDAKIRVQSVDGCPLTIIIEPVLNTLPVWTKDSCEGQSMDAVQSWFDPNECFDSGLPRKIYPGLIAAECIVKSILSKDPSTIIKINPC